MSNEQPKRKKSRYQKKLARKYGRGKIDPRWMWWAEPRSKSD